MDGAGFGAFANGMMGGVKTGKALKGMRQEQPDDKPITGADLAPAVAKGANATVALTPGSAQLPSAESMGFGGDPEGGAWGALSGLIDKLSSGGAAAPVNPLQNGLGG